MHEVDMGYVLLASGISGVAFMLLFLVVLVRESNPVANHRPHGARSSPAIEHFMLLKPNRRRIAIL